MKTCYLGHTDWNTTERVFDWGICEIKLSFIDGGQWDFNAGLKNNALDFKVKTVSIYGLAKIGGQWNGCRIVNNTTTK